MEKIVCDILIAGASVGGVAAAIAAASSGADIWLIEETNWPGGQLTAQGVSTPDENSYIETFGATRSYASFREQVRAYYKNNFQLSEQGSESEYFNPGNCWVSRLSFEPKAAVNILSSWLQQFERNGNLHIVYGARLCSVEMSSNGNRLDNLLVENAHGEILQFFPSMVLDSTDTGEILSLCDKEGIWWYVGAESREETGEPDAPTEPRPDWVQPFTFPFAIEWSPETVSSNLIPAPIDYLELQKLQNYHIKHGAITGIFQGAMPWWRYRRILDSTNFDDAAIPHDVAMINTAGNDYYGGNILGSNAGDAKKRQETLDRARRASLGYLYWLQNECPREENPSSRGYPEFRLRKDCFDTPDGCSIRPYIRESRRIRSLRPILEQEIVVKDFTGRDCIGDRSRSVFMPDSIGIGHYALDIHPNGHGEPNAYVATRPFQIPLGALISKKWENILPASKNLGVTHLTNGAYRLHPIEWNIGESAGQLVIFCLQNRLAPREVYERVGVRRKFQEELLRNGLPLHWLVDVPIDHPSFLSVQMISLRGVKTGNENDLLFLPDEAVSAEDWFEWNWALNIRYEPIEGDMTRGKAIQLLKDELAFSEA